MSMMSHREPNRVKWVGVRPGHDGIQVMKSASKGNGTLILHTVTAGMIFYLTFFTFNLYATSTGHSAKLLVRDDEDVDQYNISTAAVSAIRYVLQACNINPPIEIPAGYDICLVSNNAALTVYASIHGWEALV